MTRAEQGLWRLAELGVKNHEEEENFKALQERGSDIKTLALYSLYEKLIKAGQKIDVGVKDL